MSRPDRRFGAAARLATLSVVAAALVVAVTGDPASAQDTFGRRWPGNGRRAPTVAEASGGTSVAPRFDGAQLVAWWEDPNLSTESASPLDAEGFVFCASTTSYDALAELGLGDPWLDGSWYVLDPTAQLPVSRELLAWMNAALPGVCVEPDWRMRPPEGSQSNRIVVGSELGRSYTSQVSLQRIGVDSAHRFATGRDVIVAVLDTGIDPDHPALAESLLPGTDVLDQDDDPSEVEDGLDSDFDGEIDEAHGHGTLVAGLVHVVAPDARILPVRVLDSDGLGTASSVASGIRYAREAGASVINVSLGMRQRSEIVEQEIRAAIDAGVVVVAAAGNEGRRASDFPASVDGVLSVTAVGRNGHRAKFANRPGRLSVAAPGRNLIGPYPGDTWGRATGTSFSTALVSGAVALSCERAPGRSGREICDRIAQAARLRLPPLLR